MSHWVDLVVDNQMEINENAFLQRTEVVIRFNDSNTTAIIKSRLRYGQTEGTVVHQMEIRIILSHVIAEQFLQKYKNPDSKYVAVLNGDRNDCILPISTGVMHIN